MFQIVRKRVGRFDPTNPDLTPAFWVEHILILIVLMFGFVLVSWTSRFLDFQIPRLLDFHTDGQVGRGRTDDGRKNSEKTNPTKTSSENKNNLLQKKVVTKN